MKLFQFDFRRPRTAATAAPSPSGYDADVLIGYASQTGTAEQLARKCAEAFEAAGRTVALEALERLDAQRLAEARQALFVVATTGEGDPPDHVWPFERRVMRKPAALGGLAYGLLSLGDRQYRRFCSFGRTLEAWLVRQGAKPLFPAVEVDDLDPQDLARWSARISELTGCVEDLGLERRPYEPWRLVERQWLNPGSVGAPAFHVELEPVGQGAAWRPGDIAQILPRRTWAALAAEGVEGDAGHRDYSIASIASQGRMQLLVRQTRGVGGQLGPGSGWLTEEAAIGEVLAAKVRTNPAFHEPDDGRPMILIGNGTGLAGLRAHLLERAARGRGRNWLIFGERNANRDFFYGREIEAWRRDGVIERLDLAFSRDTDSRLYVQHLLERSSEAVRAWVADGAAIYVCGSMVGMAPAVNAVLQSALSEPGLDRLVEAGRYRRDVY
jgi:sulfite reductase (NADPH) flavoprotein alpha-component